MLTTDLRMKQFRVGKLFATPGVLDLLTPEEMAAVMLRHTCGDWQDMSPDDQEANCASTHDGSRVFGAYDLPAAADGEPRRVWVITEAEDDLGVRSHTTVLLPEEY